MGSLYSKKEGCRVIREKGWNTGRKWKAPRKGTVGEGKSGAALKILFHTQTHTLSQTRRLWKAYEWSILIVVVAAEISLLYGHAIKSIFRLAVQSSHLSLLLVARRVCCLSLGRQEPIRLHPQSDGIIQPSIKLCGQQELSCSPRDRQRERELRVEYHKSNANLLVCLSLHMLTENQWGFLSCRTYLPVCSTSSFVSLSLPLSTVGFQSHISILPLKKFLHSALQGQLSLLIHTGMYKESWWLPQCLLVRVTFTQMRGKMRLHVYMYVLAWDSRWNLSFMTQTLRGSWEDSDTVFGSNVLFVCFLFSSILLKVSHNTLVSSSTKIVHMLVRLI